MYLRGGFPETGGWEAIDKYRFMTGPEENTWVTNTITIPANTEFKVADPSWGPCNWGAPKSGDTTIKVNEPFTLNIDPADGGARKYQAWRGIYRYCPSGSQQRCIYPDTGYYQLKNHSSASTLHFNKVWAWISGDF